MATEEEDSHTKLVSQTQYLFADATTGEVYHRFSGESFTPVPTEGDRVNVGASKAGINTETGAWVIEEQDFDSMVVTDIEYEYNYIHFDREEGATGERSVLHKAS